MRERDKESEQEGEVCKLQCTFLRSCNAINGKLQVLGSLISTLESATEPSLTLAGTDSLVILAYFLPFVEITLRYRKKTQNKIYKEKQRNTKFLSVFHICINKF